MNKAKIFWLANRIVTMSPKELGFRTAQFIQTRTEKRQAGSFPEQLQLHSQPPKLFSVEALELDNFLFEEDIHVFGHKLNIWEHIDWHLDIIFQKRFPLIYSRNINTRTEAYGIVKSVWEVNRLHFLPPLCMQYLKSSDEKYLNRFVEINQSWIENNPYLLGVNWYSNIEVALRLISWCLCWEILDVNSLIEQNLTFRKFVFENWLPSIYQHCKYTYLHPSKFSSANNHLIAEVAGLFIASSFWHFSESQKWCNHAKEVLEKEIIVQHSANGINKEEASEYIQFITDFFLLSYIVGKNTQNPFSSAYENKLKQIFYYILHLMAINGKLPYYGDDDDGHVCLLNGKLPISNFQSLLTTGAALFNDGYLKSKSAGFDFKNQLLLGSQYKTIYESLPELDYVPQTKAYEEEGHFLFKAGDQDKEVYIHFDAASLGYLSIAAHGHADALSFYLWVDGVPFISDMGTYTYHSEPEWRKYFRGTLAHNTLRINLQDQALSAGPSMWRAHYNVDVLEFDSDENFDYIKAFHTGYGKLEVLHIREVFFDKKLLKIEITDHIENKKKIPLTIEQPFHLHPNIKIDELGSTIYRLYSLELPEREVLISLDSVLQPAIKSGDKDPIVGWYSPSFLKKIPTRTLFSMISKDDTFSLKTQIQIKQVQ